MTEQEILKNIISSIPSNAAITININIGVPDNRQGINILSDSDIARNQNNVISAEELSELRNRQHKDFHKYLEKQSRSKNTISTYEYSLKVFFKQFTELTKETIDAYIKQAKSEGKKSKTINIHIAALEKFAEFKDIRLDNVQRTPVPKRQFATNIISKHEYDKLLQYSKNKGDMRFYWIVKYLGMTGARVSEFIRFNKQMLKDGYIDLDTKCHSRRVYVPQNLINESASYFETVDGEWLFPSRIKKGEHITARGVSELLKRHAKKCGINESNVHPHAFRHFFAIQMLDSGVDISLLKDLLGHGDINTTQIYTQLTEDEQIKRLNNAVTW